MKTATLTKMMSQMSPTSHVGRVTYKLSQGTYRGEPAVLVASDNEIYPFAATVSEFGVVASIPTMTTFDLPEMVNHMNWLNSVTTRIKNDMDAANMLERMEEARTETTAEMLDREMGFYTAYTESQN